MINLSSIFKKILLIGLIAVLALAALPVSSVYASGSYESENPPDNITRLSVERLEHIWARMQRIYERQGNRINRADEIVDRVQDLLERMEEKDKDVTTLQTALDAFDDALKKAHPVYESAKGIINSHQGFDADGKVTDRERALETVRKLGEKLKEVREIVGEPGKALRDAIKAFRDANRPADTSGSQGYTWIRSGRG